MRLTTGEQAEYKGRLSRASFWPSVLRHSSHTSFHPSPCSPGFAHMVALASMFSAVAAGSVLALQLTSAMPTDNEVARMFKRQTISEVGSAGA
jgi:hypothetical protein